MYELIKGGEENDKEEEDPSSIAFVRMEEGLKITTNTFHRSIKTATTEEDNVKSEVVVISTGEDAIVSSKSGRLASLDVFRGLTVALMILVDDLGGVIPAINHSPWDGVTLADFVMPFFLFIVGVSLGLTYKRLPSKMLATKTALLRAAKLLVLGLLLQGGYFHGVKDLTYGVDIEYFRWMGVLQRIALAYLVAALCEIWLKADDVVKSKMSLLKKYCFQWVVAILLAISHMALLICGGTFTVKCGVRGDTGPACNAVGLIDRALLGIRHLYQKPIYSRTMQCSIKSPDYGSLPNNAPSWCQAPFDPEGILSSIMAIVSCMIGLHYGHVIVHFKDHKNRILHWMIPAFGLVVMAFILHFSGMHLNKPLYSWSYTCLTAGAAGILFTGLYVLVDVFGYRRPTFAFKWMGMHALMIYILLACNLLPRFVMGFYWKNPENNILRLIGIGK
ncbi:heparan-alpha-glucosaminide N-acetyltransferase [Ranunculus cassubicifolius]